MSPDLDRFAPADRSHQGERLEHAERVEGMAQRLAAKMPPPRTPRSEAGKKAARTRDRHEAIREASAAEHGAAIVPRVLHRITEGR